jgi:hypothetical protein
MLLDYHLENVQVSYMVLIYELVLSCGLQWYMVLDFGLKVYK